MASTFHINQENCDGCGRCVEVSNNLIRLNEDNKAYFVGHGTTATYGSGEWDYIFAAIDECPHDCIIEIG